MDTVARQPSDLAELGLAPFEERWPWLGGDLQTLRNFLRRPRIDLSGHAAERIELSLDGASGDRTTATLNWAQGPHRRPLALLVHGLTGCEDSAYMRATAAALLRAGYPVLRLNQRGAGTSRSLCRHRYHAGRSEDLARAIAGLPARATAQGVVAVGYSLGGNVLLKYLGEYGRGAPLSAAVAVSAPLDLAATCRSMMAPRNALYHRYFLGELRAETLGEGARPTPEERRAVLAARSIREFDDAFTAPRNGFAGAEDYYRRCSSANFLGAIEVPTLLVHSEDDPIVPAAPFQAREWRTNPRLLPLLLRRGGHVGFHDRRGGTWHDRAILRFFERALSLS
jgi:predicted alpha/beta-fold hydrolase